MKGITDKGKVYWIFIIYEIVYLVLSFDIVRILKSY